MSGRTHVVDDDFSCHRCTEGPSRSFPPVVMSWEERWLVKASPLCSPGGHELTAVAGEDITSGRGVDTVMF